MDDKILKKGTQHLLHFSVLSNDFLLSSSSIRTCE